MADINEEKAKQARPWFKVAYVFLAMVAVWAIGILLILVASSGTSTQPGKPSGQSVPKIVKLDNKMSVPEVLALLGTPATTMPGSQTGLPVPQNATCRVFSDSKTWAAWVCTGGGNNGG